MKSLFTLSWILAVEALFLAAPSGAFTLSMTNQESCVSTRRGFFSKTVATAGAVVAANAATSLPVSAAPEIMKTENGIKYAILKPAKEKGFPYENDLVAIEYTGYLADGTIFDATHAEGKKNALLFQVGSNAVIPGVNEMVKNMGVGEKVQAIIPPELAFGDKGICLETGECLVKPKATLVYDIFVKRISIPPP